MAQQLPVSDRQDPPGFPAAVPPSGPVTALRLGAAVAMALPAVVFAWRLRGDDRLGALLSSKVDQWTLLIGSLSLAYLAGGGAASLPPAQRQVDEVLLTAAQTVLAVVLLLDLRFLAWKEGLLFALPGQDARQLLSWVYLGPAVVLPAGRLCELGPTARALVGRIEGDRH